MRTSDGQVKLPETTRRNDYVVLPLLEVDLRKKKYPYRLKNEIRTCKNLEMQTPSTQLLVLSDYIYEALHFFTLYAYFRPLRRK